MLLKPFQITSGTPLRVSNNVIVSFSPSFGRIHLLQENGIEDEDEEFYKLSMNDDTFLPAIHLYFNDDLTEA